MRMEQMQTQQDEGYSEDTQSIVGDNVDVTRTNKPMSDAAQMLLRSFESMSLDDRIEMLRCATGALPTEQQLGKSSSWKPDSR